jgi:hypothetical protein
VTIVAATFARLRPRGGRLTRWLVLLGDRVQPHPFGYTL